MMDAFHIFYHSFLEPDDKPLKALFKEPARNILNSFSMWSEIDFGKKLGKKKLTDDGKMRNTIIAQKVVI